MNETDHKKRRYPRIDLQNLAVISRVDREFRKQGTETVSMGLGGCGFVLEEPLDNGTRLVLFLSLGHQVAKVEARVAYSRPLETGSHEVGVEFLQIEPRHRRAIRRLLEEGEELGGAERTAGLADVLVALMEGFLDRHPELSARDSMACLDRVKSWLEEGTRKSGGGF